MLNQLSIKNKLLLIILVPFFILIYFSILNFITIKKDINSLTDFEKCLNYSFEIKKLINTLQLERGYSLGYIGSSKTKFKNEMYAQRLITDKLLLEFKKIKNTIIYQNCPLVVFESLEGIRKKITQESISYEIPLEIYSNIINKYVEVISNLSSLSTDYELSQEALSLIHLIKLQEYLGQERALANQVFTNSDFSAKEYSQLKYYENNFKNELEAFKYTASKRALKYYNSVIDREKIKNILDIKNLVYNKIYKSEIVSKIHSIVGYGGLVHDFKNYLLRGDKIYLDRFLNKYTQFEVQIKKYKKYKTTKEELVYLNEVIKVFEKYKQNILKMDYLRNISTHKNIDNFILINDKNALYALNILSSKIVGVDANTWFKLMTNKINDISSIQKELYKEIIELKNKKEENLINDILIKIFTVFSLMIIVLFISYIIVNTLIKKLKNLKKV